MVRGPIVVAWCVLCASVAPVARVAHADERVDELDKQLSSSSDKTRLSAVVALAKLGDKRALKPLVTALHDPNIDVRATAVVALGHLGHKAALPSLRDLAANDPDDTVRTKAHAAAKLVARANHLPDDSAVAQPQTDATQSPAPTRKPTGRTRAGHPDVYVVVKTSSDESPGTADQDARKVHADIVRQALVDECGTHAQVTLAADDAQRWSLDTHQVDLSVVKLDVITGDAGVEVDAQLRLAISDRNGKMQSFLTGGAKVTLPRARVSSDPGRYLPQLEREALDNAMRGMFDKLLAHLRKTSS